MQSMNFKSMFAKIEPGLCRLSMNGIAVKTKDGYKAYNVNTETLVNCADFVFDVGDDMFFVIPTNEVKRGDVIIASGSPLCVRDVRGNTIEAFRYTDSSIINIIPERFMFFGNTYFYSKIVSFFGDISGGGGNLNINQLMPFMMMSEMTKGGTSKFTEMMPMMMMMNMANSGAMNPFANLFGMMGAAADNGASKSSPFTMPTIPTPTFTSTPNETTSNSTVTTDYTTGKKV